MSETKKVVEGTTAMLEWNLYNDCEPFDATGITPAAVLKDKDGTTITTTGKIEWATITASKIRYRPDAADLVAAKSPYTLHFKLTDSVGKISFYPDDAAIKLLVYAQ